MEKDRRRGDVWGCHFAGFEDGGRGQEPRNEGSLGNWVLPRSLGKEPSHADTQLLGPLTSGAVR